MTRLLALDCSAGACSAAVRDGGVLRAWERIAMDRGHAEALLPMAARVMAAAGLGFDALDAVAATVGPGSFTGVRIGLAAARGIALAGGLATVPVTSLEAVAEAAGTGEGPLLAVLDAKRRDLYGQWFGADGAALGPPRAAAAEALWAARPAGAGAVRLAGDAVAAVPVDPQVAVTVAGELGPDARAVAAVAMRRLRQGAGGKLAPLYLRAPDVTVPAARLPAPSLAARIRPATADDHAAIAGIQGTSFPDRWSLDAVRRLAGIGGAAILLAEREGDGAALGYLIGQVAGGEAEVHSLAVTADARRRGLGRLLLTAFEALAAGLGAGSVVLEVAADDPAARALYDAAGYEVVARRPGYYRIGRAAPVDAEVRRRGLGRGAGGGAAAAAAPPGGCV